MRRGLLKPCPTDRQLLAAVEACRAHANLKLEVCGIAGLPFTSEKALAQERRLVEKLLSLGCDVGFQRLEAQPGALVTQHPERFGMVSEARTFTEFLRWFEERSPNLEGAVPMVRFRERSLEVKVERATNDLREFVSEQAVESQASVTETTRLQSAVASTFQLALGDWLGRHLVPRHVANEPITVVRAASGEGLACAPRLDPRTFADKNLEQGEVARAILDVLAAFERPLRLETALSRLRSKSRLDPRVAREIIDGLTTGRLLKPVD
jgi:hypothetical protein